MTIYVIEMNPETVEKLPSPHHILDMCSVICAHIFEYLYTLIPWYDQSTLEDVRCHHALLSWKLGMLRTAAACPATLLYPIRVHYIHVSKRANKYTPYLDQVLTLDKLYKVYPEVLLELLTKLLQCTVDSLALNVQPTTAPNMRACLSTLNLVPTKLSSTLAKYLKNKSSNYKACKKATSFKAKIRIEFSDNAANTNYLLKNEKLVSHALQIRL